MKVPASAGKKESFEELRIFQAARELANRVYELTRSSRLSRDFSLADQMRRSALSVLSNIAEGFERETDAEFIRSLYFAKGSCGELRAQALLASDQSYISEKEHAEIQALCRKLSAGLFNLISYLKQARNSKEKTHS